MCKLRRCNSNAKEEVEEVMLMKKELCREKKGDVPVSDFTVGVRFPTIERNAYGAQTMQHILFSKTVTPHFFESLT